MELWVCIFTGNSGSVLLVLTDLESTHWSFPGFINNSCPNLIGSYTLSKRQSHYLCGCLNTVLDNN